MIKSAGHLIRADEGITTKTSTNSDVRNNLLNLFDVLLNAACLKL